MSDLVSFLTARYAEDWGAARDRELAEGVDTSRATRDVDAKRAILAEIATLESWTEQDSLLRILTAVYSDHPDYDPEWNPEF